MGTECMSVPQEYTEYCSIAPTSHGGIARPLGVRWRSREGTGRGRARQIRGVVGDEPALIPRAVPARRDLADYVATPYRLGW